MAQVYAIDGVVIPAATLRRITYDGSEGILGPGQLKVQPLATPGTSVRVAPGACVVQSRYPGQSWQAYAVAEDVQQSVPVTATASSGGRNDLVVARVRDGNLETLTGGATSGAGFEVIQGVAASVVASPLAAAAYCATLTFPALPLAGLILPASTATVTAGMVRDLRTVKPGVQRAGQRMVFPPSTTTMPTSAYSGWPAGIGVQVDVPPWASTCLVEVVLQGIAVTGTGRSVAGVRTYLGPGTQPSDAAVGVELGENGILIDEGASGARRISTTILGQHDVRKYAGTTQWVMSQAVRSAGTGTFSADYQSQCNLRWTFLPGVD